MENVNIISLKLTNSEKKYIDDLARKQGLDTANYIKKILFSNPTSEQKIQLSKYEDDLLTHTLNNTILIRYLVDSIGDVEAINKAKESVQNWKKSNYKTS